MIRTILRALGNLPPLRAWNAFWFGPISARPLGAFRIVFGLVYLANLGLIVYELDYWYTDAGLFRGTEAREVAGPWRFSPLHYVQDPTSVRVFVGAMAGVAVLFTLGWRTRVMGILLYLGTLSLHHRNVATASGADVLLLIMTFYLMFSPCGAAYSLDARRWARQRGTLAEPLILPWAQRLIQLQVSVVYFVTAVWKAHGTTWLDGSALHFILHNEEGRRATFGLTGYPMVLNLLALGTVVLEFALPFLLWFRATRLWAIGAGIALHIGILLLINIPMFGELMMASYLVFLSPQELDGALRRLNPLRWFGSSRNRAEAFRIDSEHEPAEPHSPDVLRPAAFGEPEVIRVGR